MIWRQPILVALCVILHIGTAGARANFISRGAVGAQRAGRLRATDSEARERLTSAGLFSALRLPPAGQEPQAAQPQDADGNALEKAGDEVKNDVKKTRSKMKEMRMQTVDTAFHSDFDMVKSIYLKGFQWRPDYLKISLCVFIPSLLWLIIYFRFMFSADRYNHQNQFVGSAHRNHSGDIAFVFDHPLGPEAEGDKATKVDPRTYIGSVFKGHLDEFPRLHKLMQDCDALDRQFEKDHPDRVAMFSPRHLDEIEEEVEKLSKEERRNAPKNEAGEEEEAVHLGLLQSFSPVLFGAEYSVTLYDVKVALLQDLCEILNHMNCEVRTFSSIDRDEIYVCCSMWDETLINNQLLANDTQVQLRSELIPKLNIKYPDFDAQHSHLYEPPFARFDPHGLVKRLWKSGVIENPDPVLVYKANVHNVQPSYIGGSERLRLIYKRCARLWDCDGAVDKGILLAWYPMHNEGRIEKLLEKWGSFRLLKDLTFNQPLVSVFHYFGARVAFMVAWNGLYAKALLGLTPIAVIVGCAMWVIWLFSHHYHQDVINSNPMGIGFSFIMVIWIRITTNLWSQEQHFLCQDFNMSDEGGIVLPTYRGELRPSEVDLNTKEKYYATRYKLMWRLFSTLVVSAFCGLVCVTTYMWDFIFEGQVTLTGSVLLAIQIKVFELVFHEMAMRLTEAENYKFQREWYDSFLWKKFTFYSVNSYYPFFYLTVIQGAAQGRCPSDCVLLLRKKLLTTMAVLTVLRIVQVVVAGVVLDLKLWWEARQLRNSGVYPPGEEPTASYEERQAKSNQYSLSDHCESMLQLVLPLGFVLIFGPSAPLCVVLCLMLFAINIRSTGTLLLLSFRRAFPHRAVGIGAWKDVISMLMHVGVFANGFFLVQYGITFRDTPVLTKCTGIFCFVFVSALMCKLVDMIVPEHADEVLLLIKRREHVLNKIAHLHDSKSKESKKTAKDLEAALAEMARKNPGGIDPSPSPMTLTPAPSPREDEVPTQKKQDTKRTRFASEEAEEDDAASSKDTTSEVRRPRLKTQGTDTRISRAPEERITRTATQQSMHSDENHAAAVLAGHWEDVRLFPGAKVHHPKSP